MSGALIKSGNLTLNSNTTIVSGGLSVTGGHLSSYGINSIAGGVSITGGSFVDSGSSSILSGGLTVNGGVFTENGLMTVDSVILTNGTMNGTGTVSGSSFMMANGSVSDSLSGLGSLTKSGVGTLFLSGVNNFAGNSLFDGGLTVLSGFISNTATTTVGSLNSNVSLILSNGVLMDSTGYIGLSSTSSNDQVVISGTGAMWTNTGPITVGNLGAGILTIANSGTLKATSLNIAYQIGSAGTINLGTFGGSDRNVIHSAF